MYNTLIDNQWRSQRLVPLGGTTPTFDNAIRVMTALLGYIDLFSVDMIKLDGTCHCQLPLSSPHKVLKFL